MAKRIHYKDGALAVYDDDTPAALTDPANNLDKVYFHSALGYLHVVYDQTRNLSMPSVSSTNGYARFDIFPNHNLGYVPFGILQIDDTQLPTCHPVQLKGNEGSGRHIFMELTTSDVFIRAAHYTTTGKSLGGYSVSVRAILLGQATKTDIGYAARFDPTTGRLTLGEGLFDTDKNYLLRNDANPDFWMSSGRTIDTNNSGIRLVLPNGDVENQQSYSGSFTGTQFFGIRG